MTATIYNGSKKCRTCGGLIGPVQAMIDPEQCATCRRAKHAAHVQGGMADGRQHQS